ncbi:MAG: hypothetical protein ACRBEE_05865 [Arenicella sp.]
MQRGIDYSFYGAGNMQSGDLSKSITDGLAIGQHIRNVKNQKKAEAQAQAENAEKDQAFDAYMQDPKNRDNMMNLYKADSKLATGLFGIVSAGDKEEAMKMKEASAYAEQSYSNIYASLQQGDFDSAKMQALQLRGEFEAKGFDIKPLEDIATAQSPEQAMSIAQTKRALAGATLKVVDPLTLDQAADNERADRELALKANDQEFNQNLGVAKFGETQRSNQARESVARGNLTVNQQRLQQDINKSNQPKQAAARKTATDENGVLRFVDDGSKVFPAVEKADKKGQKEQRKNLRAYSTFEKAIDNVDSAMDKLFTTGPVVGRFPAVSAEQQTADGAIATLAPVLKQIFRSSGEGVFTDKDQELLMAMVPTRKDEPEARKAKIANIKSVVRSKMGLDESEESQISDEDLINKYK